MADPPTSENNPEEIEIPAGDNSLAAEKVRAFPHSPGVYLMKDSVGRVIYVGKAKDLRSRAGSYFLKAAAEDQRTARLVREIRDIDFLAAESEVDALLMEARLVKDVQPKFNQDLKDDKTFPYLEIHTDEDFPRVEFTREPSPRGTRLYGPFASAAGLRGAIQVLQTIFKFRTCTLDIQEDDERWRWISASATPPAPVPQCRPLPNGSSRIPLRATRCGMSASAYRSSYDVSVALSFDTRSVKPSFR